MEIKGHGLEELTEEIMVSYNNYTYYIGKDRYQSILEEIDLIQKGEEYDKFTVGERYDELYIIVDATYDIEGNRIDKEQTRLGKDLKRIEAIFNEIMEF